MTQWIALRRDPNAHEWALATEAYGPFDTEQAARDFTLQGWEDDAMMRAWSVCPLLPAQSAPNQSGEKT